MKKLITSTLALISTLTMTLVISTTINAATTNGTVGFYVAEEDKGVSLINEDNQIKVKNYEGFTITINQNDDTQYITSADGLIVDYQLDPTQPATFTIVNGPGNQ